MTPDPGPARPAWVRVEDAVVGLALLVMAGLPVLELLLRTFLNRGVPGASGYVSHLTLWVGFLGAMVAAREGKHLSLSTGLERLPERTRRALHAGTAAVTVAVATGLSWASFQFVRSEVEGGESLGPWLPLWIVEAVLPLSFAVVGLRTVWSAGSLRARALAASGLPLAAAIGFLAGPHAETLVLPGVVALLAAAAAGAPIFTVLGGLGLLLFFAGGVPVAAIPVETYRIVTSPSIPTVPLFTLTGYILAEGQAGPRLVRFFRALVGWMPGGLAVVTTLVCAFFTTFTGASGVTILALGGLLLPGLIASGYRERFSVGLLTATGSLGLLFPPSLPVILYAVMARVPIPDLFKAGAIPGALLVAAVAAFGMREGFRSETSRPRFDAGEVAAAAWAAKWELGLPVVALLGIFGGLSSLIEAAAITVVYALVAEGLVHRELRGRLFPVLGKCVTLLGGVFMILGVAMGLTNYMVDAEVPMNAAAWVESHIASRILFLLALNLFLIVVGCLMDIFSAIVVVVPLILPMAAVYGISPLHLGIIFLANLELGYLTPPVGMNLFLASYRFERPLAEVYRAAVPFLLLLISVVLLVTYVPILTTWPEAAAP